MLLLFLVLLVVPCKDRPNLRKAYILLVQENLPTNGCVVKVGIRKYYSRRGARGIYAGLKQDDEFENSISPSVPSSWAGDVKPHPANWPECFAGDGLRYPYQKVRNIDASYAHFQRIDDAAQRCKNAPWP